MLFEDLALCSVGIFCVLLFVLFVCSEVVVLFGSFGTVSVEFFSGLVLLQSLDFSLKFCAVVGTVMMF